MTTLKEFECRETRGEEGGGLVVKVMNDPTPPTGRLTVKTAGRRDLRTHKHGHTHTRTPRLTT